MELFILFLIICIITHTVRTTYEILKVRKKVNLENNLLFGLIFTNMIILWISWFIFCFTAPANSFFDNSVKYAGAILFILGVILFFASLVKIRGFEKDDIELITNGVFSYVRHPMYLGFIFWMLGSSMYNQSLIAIIMAVIFAANIILWKNLEEIHLLEKYPDYEEYRKKTYF